GVGEGGAADGRAGGHAQQNGAAVIVGAAVTVAGGQGLAVRAERHGVDSAVVAGEGAADLLAGGHIPQPDAAIAEAAGQGLAVPADGHRGTAVVAGEGGGALPASGRRPGPEPAPRDGQYPPAPGAAGDPRGPP